MRTIKIMCLALVAVVGFAATCAGLYSAGYRYGYSEVAYADSVPGVDAGALAVADVPLAGPAAPVEVQPCLDVDGPAGPKPCVRYVPDEPGAALDTMAAAKKLGWPIVIGVGLFFALVLAANWLPWLGVGKRALIISWSTAVLAACGNTAFEGGTPWAIAFAGAGVLLKLVQSDRTVADMLKKMQPKGGV